MTKVILVIDDDAMNREVLQAFLEIEQYTVLTAYNSKTGRGSANTHHPSLIILDVKLPDGSGYDLCRELKADSATGNIPILMVTGYDEADERANAKAAGADDFLTRPFDGDDFLARVKRLLT